MTSKKRKQSETWYVDENDDTIEFKPFFDIFFKPVRNEIQMPKSVRSAENDLHMQNENMFFVTIPFAPHFAGLAGRMSCLVHCIHFELFLNELYIR